MPIAINTSRPSSANANNGNPRPTIASRRGRRSPAAVMMVPGRLPGPPMSRGGDPMVSSAAAAAAAAAQKAYSTGSSGRWKPEDGSGPPPPNDPYSHHNPYGAGPPPPPSHHHQQQQQQHGGGPPPPTHQQRPPPPYGNGGAGGYDSARPWPNEDNYPAPRSRGDANPRSYHYDPYSRGPPPPASSTSRQSTSMPPPHDDPRYHHQSHPSSRSRYDQHPSINSSTTRHSSSTYDRNYDSRGPPPSSHHQPGYAPRDYNAGYTTSRVRDERDRDSRERGEPMHLSHPPPNSSHLPTRDRPNQQPQSHGGPPPGAHHATPPRSSPLSGGGPPSSNAVGGTTLVIGGTTPIHLPKPSTTPNDEAYTKGGPRTASPMERTRGIFRGRPSDDSSNNPYNRRRGTRSRSSSESMDEPDKSRSDGPNKTSNKNDDNDEDSPQKILLSLSIPTNSFEDNAATNSSSIKTDRKSNKRSSDKATVDLSPDYDNENTSARMNSQSKKLQREPAPNNRSSPDQLYPTQRSNDFLKPNGSIDMDPSFLASFDSLTDDKYFTLDSTLGATESFGFNMGRTDSVGGDQPQILQRNSSSGNYSSQILTGGSASGIGYSPVNSFGTVSGGYGRTNSSSSNIMVVGGSGPSVLDHHHQQQYHRHQRRRSSGTQEFGMHQSYSGGPLDENQLRNMSVGSFGYSRSYGDPSSPGQYGGSRSQDNMDPHAAAPPHHHYGVIPHPLSSHHPSSSSSRSPSFYVLLRSYRAAFRGCTFLLPGLKAAVLEENKDDSNVEETNSSTKLSKWSHSFGYLGEPNAQDTDIARRRVECSVYAFGGNLNQEHAANAQKEKVASSRDLIFREKDGRKQAPTVTPSSTEVSTRGRAEPSPARIEYEEKLAGRYYENESRLSWEFEEEPPVEVPEHTSEFPPEENKDNDDDDDHENFEEEEDAKDSNNDDNKSKHESEEKKVKVERTDSVDEKNDKNSNHLGEMYCQPADTEDYEGDCPSTTPSGSRRTGSSSPQSKMRYRCKLCGQPKQNHNCPFQQSLARCIGVMVYPAVNAFTADEPGTIAPPLSEMNNFVDIQKTDSQAHPSGSFGGSAEVTPERAMIGPTGSTTSTMVSPDSLRSGTRSGPSPYGTPPPPSHTSSSQPQPVGSSGGLSSKKRGYSQMNNQGASPDDRVNNQGDLLFVDALELKPEQFRIVSQSKTLRGPDAYKYPALPLPYAQRKRLSDNLFSLSNEVPKLTDECAQVLREARERDMWDLAVAELMTQVIIILHCPEHDYRLEGLRQYLLTLGIAC